jgi:uncharacterized protein YfaP (DUF2135 family)
VHDLFTIPDFDQAHADNAWAWSQWAAASCIERNGDHIWYLELHHPDDGHGVALTCDYCGTTGHEVWDDFAEWPEGQIEGVQLADVMGTVTHNAPRAGRVRVEVEFWSNTYYSHYYGTDEYDAGVTITQLEPVEWEDDPDTEGTP